MDGVKALNDELYSLYEVKPPISKAKIIQVTKTALKALKYYKHVVHSVERFVQKCRPEYKIPGLYVVDSIIRQSRHQFGPDKDVFGPRFMRNIVVLFQSLLSCPSDDIPKVNRVLDLWSKNGVYTSAVIQPLTDLTATPQNSEVFRAALAKVEAITGQTPTLPILKSEQKPPALTADALKLPDEVESHEDVVKTVSQLIQPMSPAPEPQPSPEPQPTPLQLLQQQLLQQSQSVAVTSENQELMTPSAENTLLLQIQALTEQLLASAAVGSSIVQPQSETTSNMESAKIQLYGDDADIQQHEMSSSCSFEKAAAVQEEPDSVTMGSMLDAGRSLTPELRRPSADDVTDPEMCKTSPVACVSNDTVEHSTTQSVSPRTSVTGQLNILSADVSASAVESLHDEHDSMHVSELSTKASNNTSVTDSGTLHPGKKKKKKRSHVSNEDSIGLTAVKEDKKHKHKDRSHRTSEKNETHKPGHTGHVTTEASNKDSVDGTSHLGHEAKQKKSADGVKQKMVTDDIVNSESINEKSNKKAKSDENSASKSLVDGSRTKTGGSSTKVVRQYRHQDSIRERTYNKMNESRKKRERTRKTFQAEDKDVIVVGDSSSDERPLSHYSVSDSSSPGSRLLSISSTSEDDGMSSSRSKKKRIRSRPASHKRVRQSYQSDSHLYMPPVKPEHVSVCSRTLWIGHISKQTTEEELQQELSKHGEATVRMIPPRGCAYVCFNTRKEAAKAKDSLKYVRLMTSILKVSWAPGVGIKKYHFRKLFDEDKGVAYIPWTKLPSSMESLSEGGLIDEASLPQPPPTADVLMGSMTVHDIPLPSQPPSQPLDLADVPLPPDEQPPLPPCPPEPDTEQEPASEAAASHSTLHDVVTSEISLPNTVPPMCTSTQEEIVSHEEVAVSVPDVPTVASSADSLTQSPVVEKDAAQSTDTLQPEPVFAPAGVKPRLEVKSDLSSMFKSLSDKMKMKMKQQRQSRFSDIVTTVSAVSESGLLASDAGAVVGETSCVPSATSDVSESDHLLLTSADSGPLTNKGDTVSSDSDDSSQQPFSHVVQNMPSSVSNHNNTFTVHLQNYDVQKVTSLSVPSTEHISSLPAYPLAEAVNASTQNNSVTAMTYNVPGVMSAQLDIAEHGIPFASTSACRTDIPHGVPAFPLLSHSQFMHQTGLKQPVSSDSDVKVGQNNGTDVGYKSVAKEMPQHSTLYTVPSTSMPSLEHIPFPESSSVLQQNVPNMFRELVSNVSLQSRFPGSSGPVFEGPSVMSSMQSTFLGLPRSCEMAPVTAGVSHIPQTQSATHHNDYLYDHEESALGKQQMYSSLVSVPNSVLTQQGLPQQLTQLTDMFPGAQPRPITQLSQDNMAHLASSSLHFNQQPIRLLLPRPVLPPRPTFVLTSGQPSNLPIAVGAPLAVMQEPPSIDLPPMPVFPMPAHFMVEPPAMSVHMHQVPRPGLVTEQSPVKLQSSLGLIPAFPPDTLQSRSTPHVILQEIPNRLPAMVQMPSLAPARPMLLGQPHAVPDTAPGPIRPPIIPRPLLDIEHFPVGQQLPVPNLVQELPEVQPTCEPQNNANFRFQDTTDQLSAQLHSEYLGSRILPNQSSIQESDRLFNMPPRPMMAPRPRLEELQGPPTPQTSNLLREPSRESLRIGMSPIRVSQIRSQALNRVPNISLPVMEHDDVSSLEHLEQRGASFSGSTYSSRLPAPAAVMASSQITGSRLPDDRFQSEFWYQDFTDEPESDIVIDHPVSTSLDRVRPSSHLSQFAAASKDAYPHQLMSDRTRVPSLLDDNRFDVSQSSSSQVDTGAYPLTRRWKDRSDGGMLTVGELKAALRQRDEMNRRRMFHRSSAAEDSAPTSSYEPPSKFVKCAEDDTASELKDMPQMSDSKCDSHEGKDALSSGLDATSAAVPEASSDSSS